MRRIPFILLLVAMSAFFGTAILDGYWPAAGAVLAFFCAVGAAIVSIYNQIDVIQTGEDVGDDW